MTRLDQLRMMKPYLVEQIQQGSKFIIVANVYKWLEGQWPSMIREWHGNGNVAAANGIMKAIGDTLGGKFLFWNNVNGRVDVPLNAIEILEKKTKGLV
jgi:hypothetical protein